MGSPKVSLPTLMTLVYKIGMLHKKLFYPKVIEVRLVADQTDLHGGTAVRELN